MSQQLVQVAEAMGAKGKGILAADESSGTIRKRFDGIGVESTEANRRDYREMLFRTSAALRDCISGVILFDETLRQSAADGTPLVQLISDTGAIPGIKIDKGAKDLAGAPGEKVTEGLDGLRERLAEYYELGARFTKWRAVIDIGRGGDRSIPGSYCIGANAHALARMAALSQEQGLVPIVEPEVLMDGDHDIDRCFEVTEAALKQVYMALFHQRVLLEGSVLKPNMVLSGKLCAEQAGVDEVAEKTVRCLKRAVPAAVPSIVFLSGGQSDLEATAHLNAMNAGYDTPWNLSFSYGRALQAAPLKAWGGEVDNKPAAQAAFGHRARMNGLATHGRWSMELEQAAA
ncbi:class I fructose-bisphosphate aldolase [Candidatus Palauibacter sp.]|uniref:class I fructose-bisphosphate aldolase n=1 Tax=Candidatus Palauibacter sp. TaxID=3101350 RepID=UPI003AF21286